MIYTHYYIPYHGILKIIVDTLFKNIVLLYSKNDLIKNQFIYQSWNLKIFMKKNVLAYVK